MSDIECPYCDAELKVCHDDGFGYDEGVLHEMQCDKCEKYFTFETSISFDYDSHKADCLNGSKHKLKIHNPLSSVYCRMRCEDCKYERRLTPEELENLINAK